MNLKSLEAWFVTGSQHLYGEETLRQVAEHSKEIARALDAQAGVPVKIVFKPTVKSPEEIYNVCVEANTTPNCIGIIAWMHTFSPAKMWIGGLKVLQKPLLHLHTQYNRDIPWNSIDMDFMNLNQSAHGDREFGFIMSRMRLNRKVVVGHWQDPQVINDLGVWARAACGWHDWQQAKFVRFGDNMRQVAVTEGDKVEAEMKFGYSVNGHGIGDLKKQIDEVGDGEITRLVAEYEEKYAVGSTLRKGGDRHSSLREAARIEIGLRNFLQAGNFKGFTDTFEDLHGLVQLPGIAVQRLMAEGYGFGAEGDWKTAALVRAMKVMASGLKGGNSFMEDYTYHFDPDNQMVLGAHMLEICESIADGKPSCEIHALGIGGKADPVRLVFNSASGPAINASIVDMGNRFRLLVNEVVAVDPIQSLPKLPVARVLWKPYPDMKTGCAAWILAGGAHHTCYSQNLGAAHMQDFAEMAGIEFVLIGKNSNLYDLKNELRWNDLYYVQLIHPKLLLLAMNTLVAKDYIVFVLYFILVAGYGYWIYLRRKTREHDSKAFFLAEGSLTWWAIGASLIASNISAEQFVGMSAEGFFVGMAVSAYEWIAAIALIIIAIWFMPVYLKNKIYTMPQFLKTRYNETVALIMAVFWLFLYVFVNLTSILYLGAGAISALVSDAGVNTPQFTQMLHLIMIGLAVFALVITLGGMKVIGYTDVIQVAVLIVGGLATTWLALTMVSEKFGLGKDIIAGFNTLMEKAPDHFAMIVEKPAVTAARLNTPENLQIEKYVVLPGIAMYFAGQWIVNLNYWGCNQYITQRALGADLPTARTGILFAGFLKLLMPVIVMLPGIAAYVLHQNNNLENFNGSKDGAYSAILAYLPAGLKGLSIAALTAAIVASLAGKANSISTIFTLDIYKKYFNKEASEKKQVWVGRATVFVAMIVAIAFTWQDTLGIGGEGGFTFIQKYTGFISPGVFAMFILGMFWKRTTGTAAIVGVILGFVLAIFFNNHAVDLFGKETWMYTAYEYEKLNVKKNVIETIIEIPFLINMGWSFFITVGVMVLISLAGPKVNPKAFALDKSMFKMQPRHIVLIVITLMILAALYIRFWRGPN